MHKIMYNQDGEYNFEETCPMCEASIPILIDEEDVVHYYIDCPNCGYRMALCTLCRWDQELEKSGSWNQELEEGTIGGYKCDWREGKGCFRGR